MYSRCEIDLHCSLIGFRVTWGKNLLDMSERAIPERVNGMGRWNTLVSQTEQNNEEVELHHSSLLAS